LKLEIDRLERELSKCIKRITQLEKYIAYKRLKIPDEMDLIFEAYDDFKSEENLLAETNSASNEILNFEDLKAVFKNKIDMTQEQENELNEIMKKYLIKTEEKNITFQEENKKLNLQLQEALIQITDLNTFLELKVKLTIMIFLRITQYLILKNLKRILKIILMIWIQKLKSMKNYKMQKWNLQLNYQVFYL